MSGNQSKIFGHVGGFLEYAADAFKTGKESVRALFTPVFATIHEARNIINATESSAHDVFNQHHDLRRFGASILIRLVERNYVKGIQVALFCAWDTHFWIKDSWRDYEWRLRIWKDNVIAAVDAWAMEHNVVVREGYTGGSRLVREDRDPDSMEMAANWLFNVVTAPEKTLPNTGKDVRSISENFAGASYLGFELMIP
ncbi:hypothetical protein MFIFM68171_05733 [Madurella fahalii]|uniref:Uncharacterized protein n=1 Tax=Madurella fahalii TaxID=1157608 RepID=A0ABQ0GCM9_9PEZI